MTAGNDQTCCCTRFDPKRCNEKTVTGTKAEFVQTSLLHIRLCFDDPSDPSEE